MVIEKRYFSRIFKLTYSVLPACPASIISIHMSKLISFYGSQKKFLLLTAQTHTLEQMLPSNCSIQLLCFEIKWSTYLKMFKNVFSLECTMIILNSICCNRTFLSPYNLDYAVNTIVLEQMEIIKWHLATDFLSYSFANWKRRNQHLQSTKNKFYLVSYSDANVTEE